MKIYQVDAFTDEKFKGNPAAVCVLPNDFEADNAEVGSWMKNLAAEMNLSETAFVKEAQNGAFSLRWFTPTTEVDLCGHATLATSHILWTEGLLDKNTPALFDTRSGRLVVSRIETDNGIMMEMNFPADEVTPCKEPVGLQMALGCNIISSYNAGIDMMVEVADETTVAELNPVIQQIATIPVRCLIVTAKGDECDFGFSILFQVYVTTLFSYWVWIGLLKKYPISTVAPISLLVPVFGFIGSIVLFSEQVTLMKLVSSGLILLGLILFVFNKKLQRSH